MEDFGRGDKIDWRYGQFLIKHCIFDYGTFMPWICSYQEFFERLKFLLILKKISMILMKRIIHNNNLTINSKTSFGSKIRNWQIQYINYISRTIDNVNDAIIIQVIGDFYEVFPKCLNGNILFFKVFE